MNGKIKWYKREKGYGFITGDDGKDYFMHYTSLPEDQQDVREDDNISVTFELKETERGPQAVDIKFGDSSEEAPEAAEASDDE